MTTSRPATSRTVCCAFGMGESLESHWRMSDAIPLPTHPELDQYKKLAKELLEACKAEDPGAVRDWAARWRADARPLATRIRAEKITKLAEAQFFLARAHGFESWPKFAKHVEALNLAGSPDAIFEAAADAIV